MLNFAIFDHFFLKKFFLTNRSSEMSFGGVSGLRKKILKIFQNICWVLCLFVCLLFCCQANSRKWVFLTTFLSWKAVYRCISEKFFFERTLEFSALSIGQGRFSRFRLLSGLTTPLFPLPIQII